MSFKNCWTISSSFDFQAHQQCSQRKCYFSQTALQWFESLPDLSPVLPDLLPELPDMSLALPDLWKALPGMSLALADLSPVLPGAPRVLSGGPRCSQTYHSHSHGTTVPDMRDPSYSEGWQECPPRVWYSPEIDASKFTLHILSDTPGGVQRLKYILLMDYECEDIFWIWHWSWSRQPTDYQNLPASGSRIHTPENPGHPSQHRMSGPMSSTSCKFRGHSDIGPCGCQRGIWSHCITISQSTTTCLIIWMALCELYQWRRLHGRKTGT